MKHESAGRLNSFLIFSSTIQSLVQKRCLWRRWENTARAKITSPNVAYRESYCVSGKYGWDVSNGNKKETDVYSWVICWRRAQAWCRSWDVTFDLPAWETQPLVPCHLLYKLQLTSCNKKNLVAMVSRWILIICCCCVETLYIYYSEAAEECAISPCLQWQ